MLSYKVDPRFRIRTLFRIYLVLKFNKSNHMIMIYVVVAAAVVGSFVVACRLCRTENKTQKADATWSLFSI